jgi:hypothetical protein
MRVFTTIACAACLLSSGAEAYAQTTVSAQSASISGASGTIVATRVPVQIGSGTPSYFDVTIALTATTSGGTVTGVSVSGSSAPSQTIQTAGFQAGTYMDSVGNTYFVTGPGVGPGGATSWSLIASSGDNCNSIIDLTWYTGAGKQNPEYPRVAKAKIINPDEYSFGVSGGTNGCFGSADFYQGFLIGASQNGNGITISSFDAWGTGGDQSSPTATWSIILQSP